MTEEMLLAIKSTDPNTLEELSKTNNVQLKLNIARNPNTPGNVLLTLSNDKDFDVQHLATLNIKKRIAQNPNTPMQILQELSQDNDVEYLVAINPNTSIQTLTDLSKSTNFTTVRNLTKNPNTTQQTLSNIYNTYQLTNFYFINNIVKHNNTDPLVIKDILIKLNQLNCTCYNNFAQDDYKDDLICTCAITKSESNHIKFLLANNSNNQDVLELLFNQHLFREYLALNINTPNHILKHLLNNPIDKIKTDALNTLIKKKNLKLYE